MDAVLADAPAELDGASVESDASSSGTIPSEVLEAAPPERIPTDDPGLEAAWRESTPTQDGRIFVDPGDAAYDSARNLATSPDQYTVVIHGNEHRTGMDTSAGHVSMTGAELGELIASDPDWGGREVRLFSCETGRVPGDGSDPVAQGVADRLDQRVHAPTELAWAPPPGGPSDAGYSSTATWSPDPFTGEMVARPATGPEAPDGTFVTFEPRHTDPEVDR
jgi:hypothetical protein